MTHTAHPRARVAALALGAAACAPAAAVDPVRAQTAGGVRADAAGPLLAALPGPLAPGAKYVAMGSSYAAGPGVGTTDPDSRACARSESNYAHLLARRRGLTLVDVSCSGATTRNILRSGQNGFAPQIDSVDAGTRLVTILIGGNDVDYITNLGRYVCRDTAGGSGGHCTPPDAPRVVDSMFNALPHALGGVLAAVHARAPLATVVLVGYLPAVPESGPTTCNALGLSAADAASMDAYAARLARVIGRVADSTHTPVVRARILGAGHDACSSAPYVAGYRPPTAPDSLHAAPFHPNQVGMNRIAAALDSVLAEQSPAR